MKDGFIKAAAVTPKVQVADPEANAEEIIRLAEEAAAGGGEAYRISGALHYRLHLRRPVPAGAALRAQGRRFFGLSGRRRGWTP